MCLVVRLFHQAHPHLSEKFPWRGLALVSWAQKKGFPGAFRSWCSIFYHTPVLSDVPASEMILLSRHNCLLWQQHCLEGSILSASNSCSTLSIAITRSWESRGSQFFINVADCSVLGDFDWSTPSSHSVWQYLQRTIILSRRSQPSDHGQFIKALQLASCCALHIVLQLQCLEILYYQLLGRFAWDQLTYNSGGARNPFWIWAKYCRAYRTFCFEECRTRQNKTASLQFSVSCVFVSSFGNDEQLK